MNGKPHIRLKAPTLKRLIDKYGFFEGCDRWMFWLLAGRLPK